MEEGSIIVDSIEPIGLPDITHELAVASGFLGILDLLKVAKHGRGNNIYLIRFHYIGPRRPKQPRRRPALAPDPTKSAMAMLQQLCSVHV